MRGLAVAAALLALGTSGAARASEVVLFDQTVTADIGATAPLGIDPTLGNENGGLGGGLLSGDIGFLARAGKITITVTDLGTTATIPLVPARPIKCCWTRTRLASPATWTSAAPRSARAHSAPQYGRLPRSRHLGLYLHICGHGVA